MIYTVKKGDTLGQIASSHKTTIEALMRLNPEITDKNLIYVGQKIKIKEDVAKYTVKRGDSLYKIGNIVGVPWQEIANLNNIKAPYTIHAGQVLNIPAQAPVPKPKREKSTHTIVSGDTLWDLARTYKTTVVELEKLNPGIEARNLQPGQKIIISKESEIDIVKFYADLGWRVTSPYGMRFHPIDKVNKMHHGTDFGGQPAGHPIYSPVNGTVVRAQAYSGYGNTVVIECARGLWHILAHAQTIRVKVGDKVVAGKTILSLNGMTGTATGPHIHYQINPKGSVRGSDAIMDPRKY